MIDSKICVNMRDEHRLDRRSTGAPVPSLLMTAEDQEYIR
jgi:hypothetical protein